jgi:glycine oxidase
VPGISEWRIDELQAGLRPGTPDNIPAIGAGAAAGLWWAVGHYRNGILLAPLTAELIVAALTGDSQALGADEAGELLSICAPARFAAGPAAAEPALEAVR